MPTTKLIEDCGCCGVAGPCDICSDPTGTCCRSLRVHVANAPFYPPPGVLTGCSCLGTQAIDAAASVITGGFTQPFCGLDVALCSKGTDTTRFQVSLTCGGGAITVSAMHYLVRNGITWAIFNVWQVTIPNNEFQTNFEYDLPMIQGFANDCAQSVVHISYAG